MNIFEFDDKISDSCEQVSSDIDQYSEMTLSERLFLTGLVSKYKPKKVLEVGVAAGASSVIMLDALKQIPDSKLYSIDYSTEHYYIPGKKTGFCVEELRPEALSDWKLYTGALSAEFMDEIGDGIDFCLIDTMHIQPGEILDFLMVFPYLKKNAVVVFHDISLQCSTFDNRCDCNCMLYSAIKGLKILPKTHEDYLFPNIGAIELAEDLSENIFDIFNLLLIKWKYEINEKDYAVLLKSFSRFYDKYLVNIFVKSLEYNNQNLADLRNELKYPIRKLIKKTLTCKLSSKKTRAIDCQKLHDYKKRIFSCN